MENQNQFIFTVEKESIGERLDRYLCKKCPSLSRSQIQKLVQEGDIKVDGKNVKSAHSLKENEEVVLIKPPPESLEIAAQNIPLDILFEDKHLVVLNKSAEMVVHPGAGIKEGTLVNAILYHCPNLPGIGGVLRPGIVHRLDKGTSGVIVIAKDDVAHHSLSEQFKSREVEKKYLAFVWGIPRNKQGTISEPIGRSISNRKIISSNSKKTRTAVTKYEVEKSWKVISLLELTPLTGRTHQLRVHLAEFGHPIVADPTYGKGIRKIASLDKDMQEMLAKMPFQLLHASSLSFTHPVSGKRMTFQVPMRQEMLEFQKKLKPIV